MLAFAVEILYDCLFEEVDLRLQVVAAQTCGRAAPEFAAAPELLSAPEPPSERPADIGEQPVDSALTDALHTAAPGVVAALVVAAAVAVAPGEAVEVGAHSSAVAPSLAVVGIGDHTVSLLYAADAHSHWADRNSAAVDLDILGRKLRRILAISVCDPVSCLVHSLHTARSLDRTADRIPAHTAVLHSSHSVVLAAHTHTHFAPEVVVDEGSLFLEAHRTNSGHRP